MDREFKEAVMLTCVKRLKKAYKPAFGYILWRQKVLEDAVGEGYIASTEIKTKGRPSYMLVITHEGNRRLRYLMHYLRDDVVEKEAAVTLRIYNRTLEKMTASHRLTEERAKKRKRQRLKEDKDRNKMADSIIEALQDDRIRELVIEKLKDKGM